MHCRIALISNDNDFFDYIIQKLSLRASDEIFRFSFEDLPSKFHLLETALIIVNAQSKFDEALELLDIFNHIPVIVFTFSNDESFKISALHKGAFEYITLDTSDDEFEAKIVAALNYISTLEKNKTYREILVKNNIITENNEVFLDYTSILDMELDKINNNSARAVLAAIAPNEKTKFLISSNQVETIILNNIRENDILMNYAPNKYFIIFHNADINSAEKIWNKIRAKINGEMYAGFASTGNKNRQQLVNEALNKLHEEINKNYNESTIDKPKNILNNNFKLFKHEFKKNIEKVVTPAFYHIQQKYNNKLFGISIDALCADGYGKLTIKSKHQENNLIISSPGFSKVNIDISSRTLNKSSYPQSKRITLEPEEFEEGLLEDLLEQFVSEFRNEVNNELVE